MKKTGYRGQGFGYRVWKDMRKKEGECETHLPFFRFYPKPYPLYPIP
jgi:hypothetical protein